MKTTFVCLALIVCALASIAHSASITPAEVNKAWLEFRVNQNKEYKSAEEELKRKAIFVENYLSILDTNERYARGEIEYQHGVNQFTDMTAEEVAQTSFGFRGDIEGDVSGSDQIVHVESSRLDAAPPATFDMRSLMNPIRNQGQCGSCYAFSAIASMERAYQLQKGVKIALSEKQLVDCSASYGNFGCSGGWMHTCYNYAIAKGSYSQAAYPYAPSANTADARCKTALTIPKLVTWTKIPATTNDTMLQSLVISKGAIAIAIDATNLSPVRTGHYTNCLTTRINHAVNIVGYFTSPTNSALNYWIIRNSWGTGWGNAGYFTMPMSANPCGMKNYMWYPSYV